MSATRVAAGMPGHAAARPIRRRRHLVWTPYRLVLPAVLLEAALVLGPLVIGFWYSMHNVRFFQIRSFVGLENYGRVLGSPEVLNSLWVTAVFSLFSLVFTFVLGFALALWLERDGRAATAMRAVVLVPYMIAMLVGSMLLKWVFSQESGLSALLLGPLGLGQASILAEPGTAMAALVFNAMWRDSGFAMIMLLAGLKSIPPELHLAARVDGASAWMRFRRITLPLLHVAILITLVRMLIHFVNILTFPLILTGGGPGDATEAVVLKTFRLGFQDHILGMANALALLVFAANLVLVGVLLLLFRRMGRI
ncbi:sugar ABC transporter permease [Roseomonas sp. OT10]|uniref:carbohydrate ABC transporter permease n=1 Tax=Roseomonas cutis TaxID=2897332 RepID=UPI001E5D3D92|nr:sugar ABC transporter permease [Roseomonas sp. OT10]UFN47900.1 sugar ABC transporter permease [Roseomonas sp. OT10]